MSACWMFMILVGYRLSHAAQSQSICVCKDELKTARVLAGDNVSVPCPKLTGDEMTFQLFKNGEIYSKCSYEKNLPNCKPSDTKADVELRENTENKSVSFMLTGVNASTHDIYRCEGMKMFPPPYIKECGLRILVLVEGHQCKYSRVEPKTEEDQDSGFPLVWILVLVLVSIYSAIVTIIALVNWVKLRNTDSQSDYMNTKPRGPRKKRGVQNPFPRF